MKTLCAYGDAAISRALFLLVVSALLVYSVFQNIKQECENGG